MPLWIPEELRWPELYGRTLSRRDFARVAGSVTGLIGLGTLPGCGYRQPTVIDEPFGLGVASGEPTPDGVVLWTRVSMDALTGIDPDGPLDVRWDVARDDAFSSIVQSGTSAALPDLGRSVHVEVAGLDPGSEYFYRFLIGGEVSETGLTKTAPAADAEADSFRFAFASCQHYEQGLFTALRHLADEDLDLIVHLGDYIYEYHWVPGRVRRHEGPEIVTLDEYRGRYTTYRADTDLQAAHASAPWVVTWDDHEVENDYAGLFTEEGETGEDFRLRRAAAYQAFYEFMPLRRSSMPRGPDMELYRRLRFGTLMEMSVLDTRQYRHRQPCGLGNQPTCADHTDPSRSILGMEQSQWLWNGLAAADARWNVLAQQVPLARFRRRNDAGEETWSMDKWDGYPAERQALLEAFRDSEVPNPVVITGDVHSNWVHDLHLDFDDLSSPVVGTEFVGTSLASGGNGAPMTSGGERVLSNNGHTRFYNGQRGYVVNTLTPEAWRADYRVVPVVTEPGGQVETAATFVVEDGSPGAQEA